MEWQIFKSINGATCARVRVAFSHLPIRAIIFIWRIPVEGSPIGILLLDFVSFTKCH